MIPRNLNRIDRDHSQNRRDCRLLNQWMCLNNLTEKELNVVTESFHHEMVLEREREREKERRMRKIVFKRKKNKKKSNNLIPQNRDM